MPLKRLLMIISCLPLAAFGVSLALATWASTIVGHWPYYAHPDPKDLAPSGMGWVLAFCLWGPLVSLGLFPALATLTFALGARTFVAWLKQARWCLVLFAAGILAWVAETLLRGGRGLLQWLVD